MATAHPRSITDARDAHVLSVVRLAIAGGATAAALFILCWLGTFVRFTSPTHAYVALFSNAETSSGLALAEGFCWSLVFGLIGGALFALAYNATAALGQRQE